MNIGTGTSKLNNYLLPTTGGALKWVRQPGVVHDRVFLEAIPISCLSSLWFQWSLSVEGMKERKNTEKEMGSERKWRKERKKKKKVVKLREETFTTEDQVLPWLKQDFLKQEISSLTQQFLKSNVVLTWIRGKKRATQLFFFFFVKAYTVQWITLFSWTPWLLLFC